MVRLFEKRGEPISNLDMPFSSLTKRMDLIIK